MVSKLYFSSGIFGLKKILHGITIYKIDESGAALWKKEMRRAQNPSTSLSFLPTRKSWSLQETILKSWSHAIPHLKTRKIKYFIPGSIPFKIQWYSYSFLYLEIVGGFSLILMECEFSGDDNTECSWILWKFM